MPRLRPDARWLSAPHGEREVQGMSPLIAPVVAMSTGLIAGFLVK